MIIVKILIFFLIIYSPNVFAATYTLEIKENHDIIYYDVNNSSTNIFMDHKDMLPGETYTDTILIKSSSSKEFSLYFNFKMKEQNTLEEELLNNINMKVYINDKLEYDGVAKTSLYVENEDIKEENLIFLGNYNKSEQSNIRVETSLKDEYEIKNTDIAKTELNFFIKTDGNIISIPNTSKNSNLNIVIILGSLAIIITSFIIPVCLKKTNKHNRKGINQ